MKQSGTRSVRLNWREVIDYFGAHLVPGRDEHERERVAERALLLSAVLLFWTGGYFVGTHLWIREAMVPYLMGIALVGSLIHWSCLVRRPGSCVAVQYLMLVIDPFIIVGVLAEDPNYFAFLNPFLLVAIVRCGLRYGTRTL